MMSLWFIVQVWGKGKEVVIFIFEIKILHTFLDSTKIYFLFSNLKFFMS